MNQYLNGAIIKKLREKENLTQAELAEKICVSDKTISKWETSRGYPDISLLEPLARAFGISVMELISGNVVQNINVSANMMNSIFYVCPVCGNIFYCMGEAVITCHGILLAPCEAEESDEQHKIFIEKIEDEYYVQIEHDMTKKHYISYVAALSTDGIQMIKLYPEGNAEARFKTRGVKKILFYCNKDGLFFIDIIKGMYNKEANYDNTKERRELEATAKKLFG